MTTSDKFNFMKKGNDLAVEIGRLAALTDELNGDTRSCADNPKEVGRWITAIGKAVLAIFGIDADLKK